MTRTASTLTQSGNNANSTTTYIPSMQLVDNVTDPVTLVFLANRPLYFDVPIEVSWFNATVLVNFTLFEGGKIVYMNRNLGQCSHVWSRLR